MSKARGKIIDKWVFDIKDTTVTVPVKMVPGPPTIFVIDYMYGEYHYRAENTDIDYLKSDLRIWLNDMLTFEFKTYYYISFKEMTCLPKDSDEVGEVVAILEWKVYDIGITSVGMEMYRDKTRMLNNGEWIEGRPDIGIVPQYELDSLCALVPATPENEVALNMLSKAFDDLHAKLRTFLAPGIIEGGFIKMVSGGPNLLGDPDDS